MNRTWCVLCVIVNARYLFNNTRSVASLHREEELMISLYKKFNSIRFIYKNIQKIGGNNHDFYFSPGSAHVRTPAVHTKESVSPSQAAGPTTPFLAPLYIFGRVCDTHARENPLERWRKPAKSALILSISSASYCWFPIFVSARARDFPVSLLSLCRRSFFPSWIWPRNGDMS